MLCKLALWLALFCSQLETCWELMGMEKSALFKRNSALDILLHSCVVGHPKLDLDPRQTPGDLLYR